MMRDARLFWPTLLAASGLIVLLGLGIWQLQRMHWKDALIARIAERAAAPPRGLAEIERIGRETGDIEYLRVRLEGRFRHQREAHLFTVIDGTTGWRIVTPLLTGTAIVLVDRGFVPAALKAAETRGQGQLTGTQEIVGLARAPGTQRLFTPDNEPERNIWFWRDLAGMAEALLKPAQRQRLVPFFIEAEPADIPGGWPRGGVTRLALPNSHLQYALTWFALAAALALVYGLFARARLRAGDATE